MNIRSGFKYKCKACSLVFINKASFLNHTIRKHLQKVYEVKKKWKIKK